MPNTFNHFHFFYSPDVYSPEKNPEEKKVKERNEHEHNLDSQPVDPRLHPEKDAVDNDKDTPNNYVELKE